jgi:hypothetical protein
VVDLQGVKHEVEVQADPLFEAAALHSLSELDRSYKQ